MNSSEAIKKIVDWEPLFSLPEVDEAVVRFSRGFLRCDPSRWFPDLETHWSAVSASLGLGIKIERILPFLGKKEVEVGFVSAVDGEFFVVGCSFEAASLLVEAFASGCDSPATEVVLYYLALRLLNSLNMSWTGPKGSSVVFYPEKKQSEVETVGGVTLEGQIMGRAFEINFLLGANSVQMLDHLWRRQIQLTQTQYTAGGEITLELSAVTVPTVELSDFLSQGAVIDLEISSRSPTANVLLNGKPWKRGKLYQFKNFFAVENQQSLPAGASLPADSTLLSFRFGSQNLQSAQIAEIDQRGAIITTDIRVDNKVSVFVGAEESKHTASAKVVLMGDRLGAVIE
ncbi:MAG: FliM/FliN family flagellar motor switch protein [Candidatus Dadabacteria bacterium]|nr:MAG: FliM/FliN family flagellar motor switch protein [Candidatus Dadabacteria bacterium]